MGRAPTPTVPPAPPSSAALALGTVRQLNSACPAQVLPEAEVQFCIPWRSQCLSWTLPSLPLGARGLSARERA